MTSSHLEPIRLRSGTECKVVRTAIPLLRDSYVVLYPAELGEPGDEERGELVGRAVSLGEQLAEDRLGDAGAFTVLLSGRSTRRSHGFHVHVVLVAGRWQKAWLHFVLAVKNVLQSLGVRRDHRR